MARQMKDSGIEWIGEISEDHPLIKLKHVCQILDQYRSPVTADQRSQAGEVLYDYYGASGAIDKIDGYTIDDHVMLIGEDGANLRLRNLPLMYEVNGKAWINNHAHILKPNDGTDFYYLFYALEALDINPYITGSAQPKLSQENLKNILIPMPSLAVQRRIAVVIREKSAETDAVIERTKATIEEYKKLKQAVITEAVTKGVRGPRPMKDSGIEWIGEIPEEWEVHQFKNIVADVIDNRGRTPVIDENNNGIPLLELDSIGDKFPCFDKVSKYIGMESYSKFIRKDLLPGDVLFGTVGSVGKCSIVPAEANCCIAQNIVGYRFNDCQVQLFWYYYFQAKTFKQMFMQYNKGNIQNSIKISDMARGKVCVPSLKEQKLIVDFLDSRCAKIDAIIAKKTTLLTELETYKKSLIHEYVTGKKEVL